MSSPRNSSGWIKQLTSGRFSVLFSVLSIYILLSTLVRTVLFLWSIRDIEFNLIYFLKAIFIGFAFDLTVGLSFLLLYTIYLLLFPKRWIGSIADKGFTFFYFGLLFFIVFFSLMAEFPFWEEFGARFNFIAVDYLIYTYEVVSNINQSYPLPLIIGVLILLEIGLFFLLSKRGVFRKTFNDRPSFIRRLVIAGPILGLTYLLLTFLENKQAEFSNQLLINELGKNGVFSFFSAYRSNELDYKTFYPTLRDDEAYEILRQSILQENQSFVSPKIDLIRRKNNGGDEIYPNIILVTIESFSAEYLKYFGNKDNLTPNYDGLINQSVFFSNLYATGTRTVRGMEALTLSVPPTPGNSIVRRPNNDHLFSIATIVRKKNYHPYFIYGGDGYFDNMNNFFGGQGFDIVDRDRGNPLSENIKTDRFNIETGEIAFENAWGICDEDLYRQALKYADISHQSNKPFFQFVMTTSNHKPYTFPNGKIDLPQGERNSAVKYTDYALGSFLKMAQSKPWFKNTVFIVVADHCASSAGKWEINIAKHHIPALIYNLPTQPVTIDRLMSQIDIMPTLFGYLNWNYDTELYGKDINKVKSGDERAFIGNYRTLGILKDNYFTQIDDRKRTKQFKVSEVDRGLTEMIDLNKSLIDLTIAYYQTASERFKNGGMKEVK